MTVIITPLSGASKDIAVASKNSTGLTIGELFAGNGNYKDSKNTRRSDKSLTSHLWIEQKRHQRSKSNSPEQLETKNRILRTIAKYLR